MHPSIAQLEMQIDRQALDAAQERLDAEQGWALINALTAKWWEQGYNAGMWGTQPSGFWTADHQKGYLAACVARQSQRQAVAA